ncbi:MAG: hypothetical protein HYT93_00765 [Parcubacteria group bacterium]|nr:hypothetical protein [Parcubacteria group bacterium]
MKITIVYKDLSLQSVNTVSFGNKTQRVSLSIVNEAYPKTPESEFLFSQFGTMHLVSPLLPSHIETVGFSLVKPVRELIQKMYRSCGKQAPHITHTGEETRVPKRKRAQLRKEFSIIPFSGGKDGLYHYVKEKEAKRVPHLVHVRNMNLAASSSETEWSLKLAQFLKEHLDIAHLKNGTPKNGFDTMRSRDVFLVALMVPYAITYSAQNIVIEGFADEGEHECFSGQEKHMIAFNKLLNDLGFPVRVRWYNISEWQVFKYLIEAYPKHLAHTSSCFAYPPLKNRMQRKDCWPKYPHFPFFKSQCGACFKCYMANLARIVFDGRFSCPEHEVTRYIEAADKWVKKKIRTKGHYFADRSLLHLLEVAKEKMKPT